MTETVHLNNVPGQLWRASRHLIEAVLAPLGLFYLLVTVANLTDGLWAAVGWALFTVGWRVVARKPVPTILLLTVILLIGRTAIGLVTDSGFWYFLQPTLQNFVFATVLLATVSWRQPLIARLADDFCALPTALTDNPRVQWFFRRASLLWAAVFVANGLGTLWALARVTLGDFLVVSTAGSYTLIAVAAVASMLWFRRELRGQGIRLRFRAAASTAV